MRLRSIFVCVSALCFALITPVQAVSTNECFSFTRNLKLGMSGEDVRAVQKLLNSDVRTAIASSGVGSHGNESVYFGLKTKLAVMKFQEIYSKEVLAPAGLTQGSGFVGILSRTKFASLCEAHSGVISTTKSDSGATTLPTFPSIELQSASSSPIELVDYLIPAQNAQASSSYPVNDIRPFLMFPASYAVPQGGKIVVHGGGFTPDSNAIVVGDHNYNSLVPTARQTLEVVIPETAQKGKFSLAIANKKGVSNKTTIIITDKNAIAPVISTSTPAIGFNGAVVTIFGENFSKEWNDVVVGGKIIAGNVSSDGKSLSFTATLPVPGVAIGQDVPNVDVKVPLWFYIMNPNGVSNKGVFTMAF